VRARIVCNSCFCGKLAVQAFDLFFSGCCGVFGAIEKSDIKSFFVFVDRRAPTPILRVEMNANISRHVVSLHRLVAAVLRSVRNAKVCDSVIAANAVAVIELAVRPSAVVMQPCQTMGVIVCAVDLNLQVTADHPPSHCALPSRAPADRKSRARPPAKNSRVRVVIQNLANVFRIQFYPPPAFVRHFTFPLGIRKPNAVTMGYPA